MKKKGFTLIELLAVIVILAIIALIATPTILGVIDKARTGAAKASALGYIDAVEKQIITNELDSSKENIKDGIYNIGDIAISYKGEDPKNGIYVIENGSLIKAMFQFNKYYICYIDNKVNISTDKSKLIECSDINSEDNGNIGDNNDDNDNVNNNIKVEFKNYNPNIQKQHTIKIDIVGDNIGSAYYLVSDNNSKRPDINTPIPSDFNVNITDLTGEYYLWVKVVDENNNAYYAVSEKILLDNSGPEITFLNNGNLYRTATENEGTVVDATDKLSNVGTLYYTWSRTDSSEPGFSNTFVIGERISKQKNSAAYYLWIKACDTLDNCSVKVSEPFVGTLLADKTVAKERLDMCATSKFTNSQTNILNKVFSNRINSADTKRAKTVAAAKFLAEEFPYQIPYYLNNGLDKTQTDGHYFYSGLFLQPTTGWGCLREFLKDETETNKKLGFIKGQSYYNGFDCSGFVTWSIKNGGVSESIIGNFGTGSFETYATTYGYDDIETNLANIKSKVRPGDLVFITGHVGIITDVTSDNITIAESKGTSSSGGVQTNTYEYSKLSDSGFKSVIYLCDAYGDC